MVTINSFLIQPPAFKFYFCNNKCSLQTCFGYDTKMINFSLCVLNLSIFCRMIRYQNFLINTLTIFLSKMQFLQNFQSWNTIWRERSQRFLCLIQRTKLFILILIICDLCSAWSHSVLGTKIRQEKHMLNGRINRSTDK